MVEQVYRVLVIILLSAILVVLYWGTSRKPSAVAPRFVALNPGTVLDTTTGRTFDYQGKALNSEDLRSPTSNESAKPFGTPMGFEMPSTNPVQMFREKYPSYKGSSDEGIYKFLSQPENFKKAFPGYKDTPNRTIQEFMKQFDPSKKK